MSDPVTNVEIEDVLSSIRRLVSEDTRSRPAFTSARQTDRLVLTPALRVKDAEGDDVAAIADEPGPEPAAPPVLLTDPTFAGTGAADALDLDQDAGDDVGPTALCDDLIFARTRSDATRPADYDEASASSPDTDNRPMPPQVEPEATAQDQAPPDALRDTVAMTAASVLSGLVGQEMDRALVSSDAPGDADQGDDTAPGPAAEGEASPLPAEDSEASMSHATGATQEAAPAEEETDPLPWDTLQDETAEPVQPRIQPQTELERKIAALEEMVGRKSEDWDGDTADTGVDAAFFHRPVEVLDWQDAGAADARAEPAAKARPAAEAAAPTSSARDRDVWYGEDAATIDEDMLRDMVAEIVRQELQGALGERITRNVRKLVRREIHRVLMSQDFD